MAIRLTTVLHGFCAALLFCVPPFAVSQRSANPQIPKIVQKDGRYALLVDGAPFLMLGMQMNNSSAWPASLPKVWQAAESLHVNTVEAPIYWEQFEPQPEVFDDSCLKALLAGARTRHLRLVLLWFGTWKNGSGHYTPEWIKRNEASYPHVIGKDGRRVDSLSPHAPATLEADRHAFAMLMRHLKALDPQRTVVMVQVENEAGTWGSVRDFSPAAQKMFAAEVPVKLREAMHKGAGSWSELFGEDADEYFHAWSIARFVDAVAAAGKAEYPLPMYVNVALRDPLQPGKANTYESGGPTDNVIGIWKSGAPSVDLIGPDIYMPEYARFSKVLELYARRDNALFVPELGHGAEYARYLFAAVGEGAIGFAPFGLDYTAELVNDKSLEPFALEYRVLEPMQRELAKWNFEGSLRGVAEDPALHDRTLQFEAWQAKVSFGRPLFGFGAESPGNPQPVGGALIAQLGPDEFVVVGLHTRVDFTPLPAGNHKRQFLRVEEGVYRAGKWSFERVWNGDQTDYGLNFGKTARVLKVRLSTF